MKEGYISISYLSPIKSNCIYVENDLKLNRVRNIPLTRNYKRKFGKESFYDIGVWKIKQLKNN